MSLSAHPFGHGERAASAGPECPWRERAERTEHRRYNPDHGPHNAVSLASQKPQPIAAQSLPRSDGRLFPAKAVPDDHVAGSGLHTTTQTKLWHHEQIHRGDAVSMIVTKGLPALARWPPPFRHVLCRRGLANIDLTICSASKTPGTSAWSPANTGLSIPERVRRKVAALATTT